MSKVSERDQDQMTLGVEEEFFVVDVDSNELAASDEMLEVASARMGESVAPELNRCRVEIQTDVCTSLGQVRTELRQRRDVLSDAARRFGLDIAATGTHPSSSWADQEVNRDDSHYAELEDRFQIVARQQVICGCHVHVGFDDPELAIAAMNFARPWLPILLALSANSPFWNGRDTGFASYRMEVWARWPTAGFAPVLDSRAHYEDLVDELSAIEAIDSPAALYWYIRPSERFPTIEFRVCDVPLLLEDTVAIAGLTRALAWTCRRDALRAASRPRASSEALEAAMWRAARYGLHGELVHPFDRSVVPARSVVELLLEHVAPGLHAHGDHERVGSAVTAMLYRGPGYQTQRDTFAGRGSLDDVVRATRNSA